MANPEAPTSTPNLTPGQRLRFAAGVFVATLVAVAPGPSTKANPVNRRQALAEKCAANYPPQPTGLTFDDYFGIQHWGGAAHFTPRRDKENLFSIEKKKQAEAYKITPERTRHIENQVNRFAAGMVARANAGDKTYTFYQGGGGAFLDGVFLNDYGLNPVADDYEGFGWLWRDVRDDDGKLIKQEVVDNIYRYRDGTYYAHPHPWIMSVYDQNGQSVFQAPEGLGLAKCSSVPGNAYTQGWRVDHFDFHHLYDPRFDTMQGETWENTSMAEVEFIDKRAVSFIDNRYNPDNR